MKKSSESGDSLSAPCVVTRPKTLNIRTIGTPERRQCDSEATRRESDSDTVRSAGATLSPSGDTAEIPRVAMVRRGRTVEYHREWRKSPSAKASLLASQQAYKARHPERVAAHRIVSDAIKLGRITKGPCELAGGECKGRIEAHHDDYTKPLDVRWLCKSHHKAADRDRRSSLLYVGGAA